MVETFVAAIVCGLFIGILSGLLGIGGGMVMVPILRLGFGLPAVGATATSLFTIVPTSVTGFVTHIRNKTCVPKLGIAAGIGGAIMSPVGVLLANASPAWLVMLVAAVIMCYSSFNMFRKALKAPKEGSLVSKVRQAASAKKNAAAPAKRTPEEREAARQARLAEMEALRPSLGARDLLKGSLIGLGAGLASGYIGVGGGFIMVPLFISVLGISMKQASGTSLIAILILAIPGVVTQGMLGNIDYVAGLALACGSIPGAVLGATLIQYVPERRLRFLFGCFLVLGAVLLAVNEFGVL